MNFKETMANDIKNVFHNSNEFAEMKDVSYNGRQYNIPVILDHTKAKDRTQSSGDHSEGIFLMDIVAYISYEDLKLMPKKGRTIDIGDESYTINTAANEDGEIILGLEMMDE